MALVTETVKRVDIPHEDGEWLEIRRLSWRELEAASDTATDAMMTRMKKLGGEIVQALRSAATKQQADPFDGYDRQAVLSAGLRAWSYDAKVNAENMALLDEPTAVFAFREILTLSKPRTEDDAKNA